MVSLIAVNPNWWNTATTHRGILSIRRQGLERRRGAVLTKLKNGSQQRSARVPPFNHLSPVAHLDQWLKGDASPKIATPRR